MDSREDSSDPAPPQEELADIDSVTGANNNNNNNNGDHLLSVSSSNADDDDDDDDDDFDDEEVIVDEGDLISYDEGIKSINSTLKKLHLRTKDEARILQLMYSIVEKFFECVCEGDDAASKHASISRSGSTSKSEATAPSSKANTTTTSVPFTPMMATIGEKDAAKVSSADMDSSTGDDSEQGAEQASSGSKTSGSIFSKLRRPSLSLRSPLKSASSSSTTNTSQGANVTITTTTTTNSPAPSKSHASTHVGSSLAQSTGSCVLGRSSSSPSLSQGETRLRAVAASAAYKREMLNKLVKDMDLATAFDRFSNSRSGKHMHYSNLLAFFTDFHCDQLSIESKAQLIVAICNAKRSAHAPSAQLFVVRMFSLCLPKESYELMNILQSKIVNVSRALLLQITDPIIQRSFYRVIHEKAQLYTPERRDLHIVSDIDDTFYHSGFGLGGPKYPKKTVMPGLLKLFMSLKARVAFLTARPQFVEGATANSLRRLGIQASVLCGHLADSLLIPFAPAFSNNKISTRKFNNFLDYQKLFPQAQYIWFGDSGQADVETGLKMIKEANLVCAYIQDVVLDDGITFKTDKATREKFAKEKVYIVDNYLEVALHLFHTHNELFNENMLYAVTVDAFRDLNSISWDSKMSKQKKHRWEEHKQQLMEINRILYTEYNFPIIEPEKLKPFPKEILNTLMTELEV